MKFFRENVGRIFFLLVYLIAAAVFVYMHGHPDLLGGDPETTTKVVTVCFKLLAAFMLVYLAMLVMKELQDRRFLEENGQEEMKKYGGIRNGSLPFNLFCIIVAAGVYLALMAAGMF